MKLLWLFLALGVAHIIHQTCAQVTGGGGERLSAIHGGITRFPDEDILDVGVARVHAIAHGDQQVGEHLIEQLQADGQTTVVREVEVGELMCDSLKDAPDSTLLRFAISSTETVIAERTSYSSVDGSVMPDGKERKIWMGKVVDPESRHPKTISMTWVDPCEMESFLLKLVSTNTDGSTAITQSIPCEAGSSTEFCMVELSAVFNREEEMPEPFPMDEQGLRRRLNYSPAANQTKASVHTGGRGLQSTTTVDLMVLYSDLAWSSEGYGYTEPVLLTMIAEAIQGTNEALMKSKIDAKIKLVHVGQLPYDQTSDELGPELAAFRTNSKVHALRNLHRADLIMLVGKFIRHCGVASFNQHEAYGVSAVNPSCFAGWITSHELGHNFGCLHTRLATTPITDYKYGFVQCAGDEPFHTIMAYRSGECKTEKINYFSNPDVKYNNEVTGDAMTNCAQRIRDTMGAISHYRDPCVAPGTTCTNDYECCGDQCLEGICGKLQNAECTANQAWRAAEIVAQRVPWPITPFEGASL